MYNDLNGFGVVALMSIMSSMLLLVLNVPRLARFNPFGLVNYPMFIIILPLSILIESLFLNGTTSKKYERILISFLWFLSNCLFWFLIFYNQFAHPYFTNIQVQLILGFIGMFFWWIISGFWLVLDYLFFNSAEKL